MNDASSDGGIIWVEGESSVTVTLIAERPGTFSLTASLGSNVGPGKFNAYSPTTTIMIRAEVPTDTA